MEIHCSTNFRGYEWRLEGWRWKQPLWLLLRQAPDFSSHIPFLFFPFIQQKTISDLSSTIFLPRLYHPRRLEWLTSADEEPTQATKLLMLKLIAGAASYSCLSPGGILNLENGHILPTGQWYTPSAVQSVLHIALYRAVHSAVHSIVQSYTLLYSVIL